MAKQDVTVELFHSAQWHDITLAEDVYTRDPIEITRGRADESGQTPPAAASLTVDNRDGTYNPRNPTSALFGVAGRNTPARISVAGDIRHVGELSSWTPRRAVKGDAWTNLVASGPLRRLGQGRDPLRSALRRYIESESPTAYWSFAEGLASQFISLTTGTGSPFTRYAFSGAGTFEPGAGELAPWSGPGAALRGVVTIDAAVGMAASPGQVTIDLIIKGDSFTGGDALSIILDGPQDGQGWQIDMYASLEEIDIFEPGPGSNVDTYPGLFDGNAQRHIRFTADQDGADIDYTLYIDGEVIVTDTVAATTLEPIRRILLSPGADGVAIADVAVWAGTPPDVADYYAASIGHLGETAANRFSRLCAEEGITASVVGDADDSQPMGPQFPDTLVNQFREIEAVDDGFVYDLRDELGLEMRTGRSLYNQDPVLELDWDAYQVAPPTDPVVDDLNTRNDVTAARRASGSARAVRESGPLNVSLPENDAEGVGRYTHQVDVNPSSDLDLGNHAGWHLHRGTVDETRWPTVTVDLDATPGLATDAATVNIGDRITIDHMPADVTPDLVSLVVLGYAETVGSHRRRISYTCAPESPFHIAELEHADYSFAGSDGSTVNTAFVAGTGTSLSVAVAAGYPLWAFESTFDILVSGVRLRVTAIAGASSPQTFTVQAAPINGVAKTIAVGERVDLFHRSFVGL
jgi:hypothetical protein